MPGGHRSAGFPQAQDRGGSSRPFRPNFIPTNIRGNAQTGRQSPHSYATFPAPGPAPPGRPPTDPLAPHPPGRPPPPTAPPPSSRPPPGPPPLPDPPPPSGPWSAAQAPYASSVPAGSGGGGSGSFAAKMMKRMGWQAGQGLGKHGSGITEPVKESNKRAGDNRGIGYDGSRANPRPGKRHHGGKGKARDDDPTHPSKRQRQHQQQPPPPAQSAAADPTSPLNISGDVCLVMRRGLQVRLAGIKAKPALNGTTGVVESFDAAAGRTVVLLDGTAKAKFKQCNLIQMLPNVEVHGLKSQPLLNGNGVGIVDWDPEKLRYICQAKGGRTLSLRPANLIVPVGTVVAVVGLQSRPELNNLVGKVTWHHRDDARLLVQLPTDRQIKVRYENVSVRGTDDG